MKAYVLKVTIKDTHPPIWRRVVIPAGISFSQLNLILNTAVGWNGYHLSSYEFKSYLVNIVDEPEEFYGGFGPYEDIDAANTCIDEFLDDEDIKSFTYTYDFGDNWTHTVQIEKRLDNYIGPCPMVLKYKGDTPWEDCGGVWGFYDYIEILKNPQHEEYDEIYEWTGGGVPKYDIELVNRELTGLVLSKEKHNPMSTSEVYETYLNDNKLFTIEFERDDEVIQLGETEEYKFFVELMEELGKNDKRITDILAKKNITEEEKFEIHNALFNANIRIIMALMVNDKLSQKLFDIMGEQKAASFIDDVNNSTIEVMDKIINTIMSEDN